MILKNDKPKLHRITEGIDNKKPLKKFEFPKRGYVNSLKYINPTDYWEDEGVPLHNH